MSSTEAVSLETEIEDRVADQEIETAVSARHSIARKHVQRLRRRSPDATPAELIRLLERQYAGAITTAGIALTAAGIGISLIPIGGAAVSGAKAAGAQAAKQVAKETAKIAAKQAAKGVAKGVAKQGVQRVAALLPAGEQQLQFEITAIFALALAEIHGIEYDKDQAHALVFGLTNERVSAQQIATMAADLAGGHAASAAGVDRSQWATTLAEALPGNAAKSLVSTMQTGHLDSFRDALGSKQQHAVDYGVAAVASGVTRFVFGREVIDQARAAFPEAPDTFPARLAVPLKDDIADDEIATNAALVALENAGSRITDLASSVGGGVVTATRVFRSVDLDGDGIPDEARALTAVKGAGGAVVGAAGAVGGRVTRHFRRGKRDEGLTVEDADAPVNA